MIFTNIAINSYLCEDMTKRTTYLRAALALLLLAVSSCDHTKKEDKTVAPEKVMILWSAGFNSISSYLEGDIEDLKEGTYVPSKASGDILLVVSKLNEHDNYKTQVSPTVVRVYKDNSQVVSDTVMTLEKGTPLASAETVNSVLTKICSKYAAKSYGMIISSHGTGWLPEGYYNNAGQYESLTASARTANGRKGRIPYVEPIVDETHPAVKTIGQDVYVEGDAKYSLEMGIDDFASAIPMHLDYLILDACLMGGVETAYELRDKADYVAFSPAETLAEGFFYRTMAERLLEPESPDVQKVCQEFYNLYAYEEGDKQSATITLVKTSGMDALAATCKTLFEKYREAISAVDPGTVQGFFRYEKHYYYDMEDILEKAGASSEDLAALEAALDGCIAYKAATPAFLPNSGGFDIDSYCGMSMYLPADGTAYLDEYYKSLSWNKATRLVEDAD